MRTAVLLTMMSVVLVLSGCDEAPREDRKSTRLNSSHITISYAVFCLKKKKKKKEKKKKKNSDIADDIFGI